LASASAEFALAFHLSPGNNHDAPEGRILIGNIESDDKHLLLMDKAYEDEQTRNMAIKRGFIPVVPPKLNRKEPWDYDKEAYKKRNEIERYFLRLKRFRKVFTRYDKLDTSYLAIVYFAMILDAIIKHF
jgi:transposase